MGGLSLHSSPGAPILKSRSLVATVSGAPTYSHKPCLLTHTRRREPLALQSGGKESWPVAVAKAAWGRGWGRAELQVPIACPRPLKVPGWDEGEDSSRTEQSGVWCFETSSSQSTSSPHGPLQETSALEALPWPVTCTPSTHPCAFQVSAS